MHILTKISLLAVVTMAVTIFVEYLGVIDSNHSNRILYVILTVQIVILIYTLIIIFLRNRKMARGVRLIRFHISEKKIEKDVDVFPDNIYPTHPKKSTLFKIFLQVDNVSRSDVPNIIIVKKIGDKVIKDLKGSIVNIKPILLDKDRIFVFDVDILVNPGEKINIFSSKDIFVKSCFLGELYVP